jgi:hypothetical protein
VFRRARFEQAHQLGPLLVYSALLLNAAHFAQLVHIEASARGLNCHRTRFPAGVQFRLRGAQIALDGADLSSPSILVGIAALSDARLARREQRLVQAVRRLAPPAAVELSARPRLLSVQGANVAGLTVSNVDLAECRFADANNLDRLRLEAKVTFSAAPVRLPWDYPRRRGRHQPATAAGPVPARLGALAGALRPPGTGRRSPVIWPTPTRHAGDRDPPASPLQAGHCMRMSPSSVRNTSVPTLAVDLATSEFRERRARRMPTAMKSAGGSKQPGIGPGVRDRAR